MSVNILSAEVRSEDDVVLVQQRARQVAGLLGFPPEDQARIATAAGEITRNAVKHAGGGTTEFLVEDGDPIQVFLIRIYDRGPGIANLAEILDGKDRPGDAEGGGIAGARRLMDRFQVEQAPGGGTVVELGKDFTAEAPAVAGQALARIAGELAKRSRPQSMFVEIERHNQELFRAMNELARLNRELGGYAHTVSHDLKSPLTSILLANEILREKLKSPQADDTGITVDKLIDTMNETVRQTATMIDDLLALAEAGQEPREVSRVDVSVVVAQVLVQRSGEIAAKGVKVKAGDNLGHVYANAVHVYQVFSNLIGNAIKHNDSTDPVVKVSYLGDDESGGHRYIVRDNGSGIPPEELDDIFVPFFKGKRSGDTGVGLATVEKIVKVYGGEIKARNDKGACFEFTLKDYRKV